MDELPVFISYRADDAVDLARTISNSLQGRTVFASNVSIVVPKTITVFFDRTTPPVEDWKPFFDKELDRALVLIVICSPGSATEFANDYFYKEIRWWIGNQEKTAPILVTPNGREWIPPPLKDKWPNAQTIDINQRLYIPFSSTEFLSDADRTRFLTGIIDRIGSQDGTGNLIQVPGVLSNKNCYDDIQNLYVWEKNKEGLYIACNDNYARMAGFDSPSAVLGKCDDDMPWKSLAEFFRDGDHKVMDAEFPSRRNVQEIEIMVDRVANILVNENQLLTKNNECVGVVGSFVDITNFALQPSSTPNKPIDQFALGSDFGGETLSGVECNVLKGVLRKFSSNQIAVELGIGKSEVDSCVLSIMRKLQCSSSGDIIATAVRAGLPFSIFGLS